MAGDSVSELHNEETEALKQRIAFGDEKNEDKEKVTAFQLRTLTPQRAVTGAGHSENEPCQAMTTTDRHDARCHSLDNIWTT
jgi:hypothetical protein